MIPVRGHAELDSVSLQFIETLKQVQGDDTYTRK